MFKVLDAFHTTVAKSLHCAFQYMKCSTTFYFATRCVALGNLNHILEDGPITSFSAGPLVL